MDVTIKSLFREPCAVKAAYPVLTGGLGRRTVRQRALILPTWNVVIGGARGDPWRACGTYNTPPSAACSAYRARAAASRPASTADPRGLHQRSTTPRAGTTRWAHTGGATTPSLTRSS